MRLALSALRIASCSLIPDSTDSRDGIEGQAVRAFQLAFFGDPDYAVHDLGIMGWHRAAALALLEREQSGRRIV